MALSGTVGEGEGRRMAADGGTRAGVIERAERYFDDGGFVADLARLVAVPTQSQRPDMHAVLHGYLADTILAELAPLGFAGTVHDNPDSAAGPLLLARRDEAADVPTVLIYAHGDVVLGQDEGWRDGLSPWRLTVEGERLYGRGTADNKGQHWVNLSALAAVIAERGRLGFNCRILMETDEERGCRGLRAFCAAHSDDLAADVLIASDGPRLRPDRASVVLGSRGTINFEMRVTLRDGAHHSGNWGGLIADPGIRLVHAIASVTDARGQLAIPEWRPTSLTDEIRALLADCDVAGGVGAPAIDDDWGEAGLSAAERVYGWNSFAVLALELGDAAQPINAIAPAARAVCQLRYVVGTDPDDIIPALRRHLDRAGFADVDVTPMNAAHLRATRLDPADPWVAMACASVAQTTGAPPALVPNIGGSIPNDIFANLLGLPTIWVPHSYPGCSQHAPNEHMLAPVAREGLAIMAGLFWDLGGAPARAAMAERGAGQ